MKLCRHFDRCSLRFVLGMKYKTVEFCYRFCCEHFAQNDLSQTLSLQSEPLWKTDLFQILILTQNWQIDWIQTTRNFGGLSSQLSDLFLPVHTLAWLYLVKYTQGFFTRYFLTSPVPLYHYEKMIKDLVA